MSATALAARVRSKLGDTNLTVFSGTQTGKAEDLAANIDKLGLIQLATSAGIYVVSIVFFVVAGTVRAVGRDALAQPCALTSSWRDAWPNTAHARSRVRHSRHRRWPRGLPAGSGARKIVSGRATAHQLLPPSPHAWTSPLMLLVAAGAGIFVAEAAGMVSARRVSRIRPAAALVETTVEPRLIHPVRLLLGLGFLGGGGALCFLIVTVSFSVQLDLTLAIATGLSFLIAIALLGPVLVRIAELVLRLPLLLVSGVGGRLALADVRRRPRRLAAAVTAVALGVGFVSAEYLIDVTQTHGAVVQGGQRLVANVVVSAPGPGLAASALPAIASQPGVSEAIGLIPTTVFVPDPGNDSALAEAVTPGSLGSVLNLQVISGSLDHFGPGDIALSKTIIGPLAVNDHVGKMVTTYLADGTVYRARLTAIYQRSLGFADVVVPVGRPGAGTSDQPRCPRCWSGAPRMPRPVSSRPRSKPSPAAFPASVLPAAVS